MLWVARTPLDEVMLDVRKTELLLEIADDEFGVHTIVAAVDVSACEINTISITYWCTRECGQGLLGLCHNGIIKRYYVTGLIRQLCICLSTHAIGLAR